MQNIGINFSPKVWTGLNTTLNNQHLTIIKKYFDKIRIQLREYNGSTASLAAQKVCIEQAVALNFTDIIWGVTNKTLPINNSNWALFRLDVIAQAEYANGIGVTDFQVGNEIELDSYRKMTATSVTHNGVIATVTKTEGHSFNEGDEIEISGAEGADGTLYNGNFTISNVTANTFDYTMAGTPTANATGWIKAGWSLAWIRNKVRSLASEVKALYPDLKLSYSVSQDGASNYATGWIIDGNMGDLDYLYLNVYSTEADFETFKSRIEAFQRKFGAKAGITEWNLHPTWSSVTTDEDLQAKYIQKRRTFLLQSKLPAYFFCYQWNTTNDPFSAYKQIGEYRKFWTVLTINRKTYVE